LGKIKDIFSPILIFTPGLLIIQFLSDNDLLLSAFFCFVAYRLTAPGDMLSQHVLGLIGLIIPILFFFIK